MQCICCWTEVQSQKFKQNWSQLHTNLHTDEAKSHVALRSSILDVASFTAPRTMYGTHKIPTSPGNWIAASPYQVLIFNLLQMDHTRAHRVDRLPYNTCLPAHWLIWPQDTIHVTTIHATVVLRLTFQLFRLVLVVFHSNPTASTAC